MSTLRGLAAIVLLGGCLVTDQLDPPVLPNAPPVLFDVDDSPLSMSVINDVVTSEVRTLDFEVEVQDLNVTQNLVLLALIDLPGGESVVGRNDRVLPNDGDISRRVNVSIPVSRLQPPANGSPCRRLTVLVSGGFEGGSPQPIEAGDLGRAVYWLRVVERPEQEVSLSECPE